MDIDVKYSLQFGVMLRRGTSTAIFILRHLEEMFSEKENFVLCICRFEESI